MRCTGVRRATFAGSSPTPSANCLSVYDSCRHFRLSIETQSLESSSLQPKRPFQANGGPCHVKCIGVSAGNVDAQGEWWAAIGGDRTDWSSLTRQPVVGPKITDGLLPPKCDKCHIYGIDKRIGRDWLQPKTQAFTHLSVGNTVGGIWLVSGLLLNIYNMVLNEIKYGITSDVWLGFRGEDNGWHFGIDADSCHSSLLGFNKAMPKNGLQALKVVLRHLCFKNTWI